MPSAAILVLDMLAATSHRRRSAQELCRAGAIMGFSDATIRVALTRLAQQEKIEKHDRASYSLNTQGNRLQLEIENWRERVAWIVPWRGDWIVVHDGTTDRSDKTSLRRHRRALLLRGLQKWKQGLYLRPNNLAGGAASLRVQLSELGLAKGAELFVAGDFCQQQTAEILGLWNIPVLRRNYEKLLARAKDGQRRLLELRPEAAARESLLVGRELISHVMRDPLLPSEILKGPQLRELAQAIADYQNASKRIWDDLLNDQ
ncbi:hypothetical protein [Bradyrhizobium sp. NAS80.1]|uniref:hypothetical protein n=1 Tax=Bradyrhizobium sp. NAS80.1 TaxID=1680159 RepID=UPI000A04E72E|nr:hypothetical protein [Bradyrhizobium sp. NAS80.1]